MSFGTKVQIFGQSYTIAGDLDEAYVRQLAAYVDERMQAISNNTSTIDTQKAAVLAALSIADELHSLRKRARDSRGTTEGTSRALPDACRARD